MYDAVDLTDIDEQPVFEHSFVSYYYFVAFIGKFLLPFFHNFFFFCCVWLAVFAVGRYTYIPHKFFSLIN